MERELPTHPNYREEAIMELKRAGSQPSQKGPVEFFTGSVRIDPLNAPPEPARATTAYVTFEPGARRGTPIPWARR
jgi:quercetin dioxygenase-like cupin family protein